MVQVNENSAETKTNTRARGRSSVFRRFGCCDGERAVAFKYSRNLKIHSLHDRDPRHRADAGDYSAHLDHWWQNHLACLQQLALEMKPQTRSVDDEVAS